MKGHDANGFENDNRTVDDHAIGNTSNFTPAQMVRLELYESIPFTSMAGMGLMEKCVTRTCAMHVASMSYPDAERSEFDITHDTRRETRRRRSAKLSRKISDGNKDSLTFALVASVAIGVLNNFLMGYNMGIMNTSSDVAMEGHGMTAWAIAVSIYSTGGPWGCRLGGYVSDAKGRKTALTVCFGIYLVGGIVQAIAFNMASFILGRFLSGFAGGFSLVIVPLYLGELAPPKMRGGIGTSMILFEGFGILVSVFVSFSLATVARWRILFWIPPVISLAQILLSPFLLESPRWLLNNDRESKEARKCIKKLRGYKEDSEVETEARMFISADHAQSVDVKAHTNSRRRSSISIVEGNPFVSLFKNKETRIPMITCVVLNIAQQLSGITAIYYYSTDFFKNIMATPLLGTAGVASVMVLSSIVSIFMIDVYERHCLVLVSSGGMLSCCILVILTLLGYFHAIFVVPSIYLFIFFFSIGLGTIPSVIVVEMFDPKYVATAMTISGIINRGCCSFVSFVFPYMDKYLGAFSFAPFAFVLMLNIVYTLIWFPETRHSCLEKLSTSVQHRMSMRNSDFESISNDPEWREIIKNITKEDEDFSE